MKKAGVAVLALVVLAACGGSKTSTNDVKVNGKPLAVYNACIKPWNQATGEWNRLVTERDASGAQTVVVDGKSFNTYADWAQAHGKPVQQPNC